MFFLIYNWEPHLHPQSIRMKIYEIPPALLKAANMCPKKFWNIRTNKHIGISQYITKYKNRKSPITSNKSHDVMKPQQKPIQHLKHQKFPSSSMPKSSTPWPADNDQAPPEPPRLCCSRCRRMSCISCSKRRSWTAADGRTTGGPTGRHWETQHGRKHIGDAPWENHGKTMGKPWENHGKTMDQMGKNI